MTLTDKPLSELQALRDRQATELAETEAAIAVKASEPDWTPAVKAYCEVTGLPYAENAPYVRKGLIAALPLAPAEPVDVEALAWECVKAEQEIGGSLSLEAALLCIRATLARCARWPVEELRDQIAAAYHAGATDVHRAWEQGLQGAADDLGEAASDYASNVLGAAS